MIRVTADSNIYISALQFGGLPLRFLNLARAGQIELAISAAILEETTRILAEKFHWAPDGITALREEIGGFTQIVAPMRTLVAVRSDPDDNRVLECAAAAGSEVIVTGDQDLLGLGSSRAYGSRRSANSSAGPHMVKVTRADRDVHAQARGQLSVLRVHRADCSRSDFQRTAFANMVASPT